MKHRAGNERKRRKQDHKFRRARDPKADGKGQIDRVSAAAIWMEVSRVSLSSVAAVPCFIFGTTSRDAQKIDPRV
ncbi:hypothetical protein MRX96_056440 [Rhipicephalus microplus]